MLLLLVVLTGEVRGDGHMVLTTMIATTPFDGSLLPTQARRDRSGEINLQVQH